ncbi:uncharacterized protein LACBIDRAFT_329158 [Laccaria bicolor S238N-H82]|uniref:Predicted protein n=1 Tax=Laccaria bicolor (strain S238N-H82 / ATCC MYA-4686) TaxID=486041 RepID=B0DH86_LACBS|nr:uncharacterized protein LACBIDRAFT_329158 [Laccaria bicolor S238N-H82]EDR06065.1 predicted protein [Laccaria bicolor S238N-H82]|eukprot:XP_001883353.1 predicted protein [Laccaria bicolor S238N-H82]
MAEGRYNLHQTLHLTPKSKTSQATLTRRKNRKGTASPSPSPTPPLPPQPNFCLMTSVPESFDMDTGKGSSGQFDDMPASDGGYETIRPLPDAEDHEVDPTMAEVDYWLGAGASQEIASMCVDADLSPDEDISPSSVEGNPRASAVPLSVDEELENRPPQDGRGSPYVNPVDAPLAPPLPDNPFPPLNPYPQFIFPDPMLTNISVQNDAPKEVLPRAHDFALPWLVLDDLPIYGPSSTLPKDMAKEAYFKALGFGPPGALSVDHTPSSALPSNMAKEAYLQALGFGPPGALSVDCTPSLTERPARTSSSALPIETNKEDNLLAHGFGPPGALPGGFEVQAHLTHPKTSLGTSEADFNVPAEDEDSFLFPNSDDSPLADDVTRNMDESKEPVPRQQAGRISSSSWDVLNTGFQKIDDIIDQLANKTGRTHENIITLWKRTHAHECTGSMWNKYQKYFLANREKEHRRIGDSRANCRTCLVGFKEHEPRWREILEAYDEVLAASNVHSTISQRTRKFDRLVSQLKRVTNKAAEQDGFESLFVLVGNSIHEDVGLSQVHLLAGAEEFLQERLHMDHDTMSGLFKNHVCNRISLGLQTRLETDWKSLAEAVNTTNPKKPGPDGDSSNSSDDDDNTSKSSGLTLEKAKVIIKTGLQNLLEPYDLRLSFESIPWSKLSTTLAPAGLRIENWTRGVDFPRSIAKGATGIKDLGIGAIRRFAESFASDATRIRVVRADPEMLLTSKVPLYMEAPPGPSSVTKVTRRGYLDGHVDQIMDRSQEKHPRIAKLPPAHEIIEIKSSPPLDRPTMAPLKRRPTKKSKEIVSSSDISDADADDTLESMVTSKSEKAKTTAKALKGKGKATATKTTAMGTASGLGAAPAAPSDQLKLISAFSAVSRAVAAMSTSKPSPPTVNPAGSARIQPHPIKHQPPAISAARDPFTVKEAGASGNPKGVSMRPVAPSTSTIHKSTTTSKRGNQQETSHQRRQTNEFSTCDDKPLEEPIVIPKPTSSVEDTLVPGATSMPTPPPTQGAGVNPTQGYQWPYGFFPPFSFPPGYPAPPPGWTFPGMPPWNPDRPAGSASDSAPVPPYPPHLYFPQGAFPTPSAKPAEGEPGPSRLTS